MARAVEEERARQFRDSALPLIDEAYSLARYLLGGSADAEDAVQECYLRAYKHLHTYRGPAIKPWLFAILRNVCHAERARNAGVVLQDPLAITDTDAAAKLDLRPDPDSSPETEVLRRLESERLRDMVANLPEPFREALVLREMHDMTYREIASIVHAPVGTVMSRLARARSLLRRAWLAEAAADDGP